MSEISLKSEIENLSIFQNNEEFRSGTIPASYLKSGSCFSIELGKEYSGEVTTLEGTHSERMFKKMQIVFVGGSMIAIENTSSGFMDWELRFVQDHFANEALMQPVYFDEIILRKLLEAYPEVFLVEQEPSSPGNEGLDSLRISGKYVTQSRIYEEFGVEPLRRVKIRLLLTDKKVTTSFYKGGRVSIFSQDKMTMLSVLHVVSEKIVAQDQKAMSFQRRLSD